MNSYSRGEDNQETRKRSVITRETIGMTLLFFSVILLIFSIIGSYILGEIGVAIAAFLHGLWGYFIYPFLLLCIYTSLVMITGKKFLAWKWLWRTLLVVVCVFLIAHLGTSGQFCGAGYGNYLDGCWNAAEVSAADSTAGGVIFGLVVYPVRAVLSAAGAYVVFTFLLIGALILFLWATPLKKRIFGTGKIKKVTQRTEKSVGEVAFEDLPPRTATLHAEERPNVRYVQDELRYEETSRPTQRPAYEAPAKSFGYEQPGRAQTNEPLQNTLKEPTGRDILFAQDPVRDYWSNLAYRREYNERPRRSTVQPVGEQTAYESEPAALRKTEIYPSYSEKYEKDAQQPQGQRPRNVVEQKSEPRESGYTLRGEDLNYTQIPSYKAADLPSEHEKSRDFYENDVPTEFSSVENVFDDQPERFERPERFESEPERFERTERFEPEPERFERAERFEPEPEIQSEPESDLPSISDLFSGRRESDFGSDREISFDDRDRFEPEDRDAFINDRTPARDREPRRTGFGESEEDIDSRAIEGLGRGSRADLFENDEPEEFDAPLARRAGEFAPERGTPAPAPKKKHVYRPYQKPSMSLLRQYDDKISVSQDEIERNSSIIIDTLAGFRVDAEVTNVTCGPAVTRYDIDIPRNISLNTVTKRSGEIAMRLHARDGVNMYANNETGTISIEVPNAVRATVGLLSVMQSEEYQSNKPGALMFAIGKDIEGRNICGNIPKMTHILVAGATNAGKSVALNAMIISLICKYSPEELRLILIDPKRVEFPIYEGLPHLMINEVISDVQKAIMALNWAIKEMERRYEVFEQKMRSGIAVRNVDEYNANLAADEERMPKLVIVVDELAELMLANKKDMEERIQRLTQKARAAGIHLVLATQRPSVDVITGVIKGNLPTRMAVRVIQEVDSRTILDEGGAEKLLGMGDMIFKTGGMFNCLRVQGAFIDTPEVQAIVEEIKANNESYYDSEASDYINKQEEPDDEDVQGGRGYSGNSGDDDPLYVQSLAIVVKLGSASISLIQRKCSVGYNHAGKIMEWMEEKGYVSPFDGKAKARTVLLTKEEFESKYGPLD